MRALKSANLFVKFVLELAAVASFAYWGQTIGSGAVSVIIAVAVSAAAVVLWGIFAAPRSSRRLPVAARVPFELAMFACAALALLSTAGSAAALGFASAVILNTALLTVFHQWER